MAVPADQTLVVLAAVPADQTLVVLADWTPVARAAPLTAVPGARWTLAAQAAEVPEEILMVLVALVGMERALVAAGALLAAVALQGSSLGTARPAISASG